MYKTTAFTFVECLQYHKHVCWLRVTVINLMLTECLELLTNLRHFFYYSNYILILLMLITVSFTCIYDFYIFSKKVNIEV